jgi:hypothetical protein
MKVEIRLGVISENTKRVSLNDSNVFFDDIIKQKQNIYDFLYKSLELKIYGESLIIENINHFSLYLLNNCFMRYVVNNNLDKDFTENYIPIINPENIKVVEIDEGININEICIQDEEGLIANNWFDRFILNIMDDYYSLLNYYEK